jgi:hypothetical protein
MSVIPALRRLRQEDLKFQASLGYMVRLCLKNTNNKMEYSYKTQLHKNIHRNYIQNNTKLVPTQISIHQGTEKQIVVYSCDQAQSSQNDSHRCVKQKKPSTRREYMLHNPVIENSRRDKTNLDR